MAKSDTKSAPGANLVDPKDPKAGQNKAADDKGKDKRQSGRKRKGVTKAAMLLISLGTEAATEITRHLTDDELEDISQEIVSLGAITPEDKKDVIQDFTETALAREFISQGGEEYAREMLIGSLGERKAKAILNRFRGASENNYFGLISTVDADSIANFLKKEHPQTIALVLGTLPTDHAGQILVLLPEEMRTSIAYRMATCERPSPEVITEIQGVLGDYVLTDFQDVGMQFGGTTQVAETFNEIEQSVWKNILEEIEEIDLNIADEIKQQMFTFSDLVMLDTNSIQAILKEVDSKDLALALKGAAAEVKTLIFDNMSKRAAAAVREEMEYMGAVRVAEVEGAQQAIIEVVRTLENEGTIVISGRGEEAALIE
ncbi:MAG: flagellar motor switch protein FliG [bacterium]|nr:flagellar motor switch protein FliG [bacterium]